MPEYPAALRDAGVGGYVTVFIRIGRDWEAQTVNFVEGDPRLEEVTLEALKKWRFKPMSGVPLVGEGTIDLRFDPETGAVRLTSKLQDTLNRVDIPPPPKVNSSSR
jgi:TonB family protein